MSAGISRRRFLGIAAGAASAAVLGGCSPPPSAAEAFVLELVGEIAVPDPLAIGELYLRGHRQPADAEGLLAAIFSGLDAGRRRRQLAAAFRDRMREDFENRATVEVDGWLLSRTEAGFCALLVLDYRGGP